MGKKPVREMKKSPIEGYNKQRKGFYTKKDFSGREESHDLFVKKRPLAKKIDPRAQIPGTKDIELVKGEESPVFKFIVQRERKPGAEELLRGNYMQYAYNDPSRKIQAYTAHVVELRPKMMIDDKGNEVDVSEFVSTSLKHDKEWHVVDLVSSDEARKEASKQALLDVENTKTAQEILEGMDRVTVPDVSHYEDKDGRWIRRIRTHAGDVDLYDLKDSFQFRINEDATMGWHEYRLWKWDHITKEFSREDLVDAIGILKKAVGKLHEAGYAHNNLARNVLLSKKEGKVHVSIIDWDMMTKGNHSNNFDVDKSHLSAIENSLEMFEEIPKLRKWLKRKRYK